MSDFFISYNQADSKWAEWIAWHLEEAGYLTKLQAWDFRPGSNFVLEMHRAIEQSKRVIVVLSPDYLAAQFTQPEWAAAFGQDPTGSEGILLPVRVQECDIKGLLPPIIYIDLVGLDMQQAIDTLLAGVLRQRSKPEYPPAFPNLMEPQVVAPVNECRMNVETPTPEVPIDLPSKTYHRLVGRLDELALVMDALRSPLHKPMVAIVGMGGMGKTALAREAVDQCLQEHLFSHVVWTSAQTERFVGAGIIKTEISEYDFDRLLNDICWQCGRPEVVQVTTENKLAVVKLLLSTQRVLVVMDNMETVRGLDRLVDELFQILGKGKMLITSRHKISHDRVFELVLGGFSEDESVTFLREISQERGIEVVSKGSREHLTEIHMIAGGAPLAMRLVVGQMMELPITDVLATLWQASFGNLDYEFYRFLYRRSWDCLGLDAKTVLIQMSHFASVEGGRKEAVREVSGVPEPAFTAALVRLVSMSLVNAIGDLNCRRYTIHPLTNYFIHSDIISQWE